MEAARRLLHRVDMSRENGVPRALALVPSGAGSGAAEVSHAVAGVLAEDFAADVCLVDLSALGDSGGAESSERQQSAPDFFAGQADLISSLDSDPSGRFQVLVPPRPTSSYKSIVFQERFQEVREAFDHVVVEAPPASYGRSAWLQYRFADAYILVVRQGDSTISDARNAVAASQPLEPLGAVLTGYRNRTPRFIRRFFSD